MNVEFVEAGFCSTRALGMKEVMRRCVQLKNVNLNHLKGGEIKGSENTFLEGFLPHFLPLFHRDIHLMRGSFGWQNHQKGSKEIDA